MSIGLWVAVLLTDCLNQWGPTGVKMDTEWFWPMLGGIAVAMLVTSIVYPRSSGKRFRIAEQTMLALAIALVAFQASASGGAGSPFLVWLLFTAFYAAYFMPFRQMALNTALMVAVALTPLFYGEVSPSANEIIFAAVLCAVIVLMSATLFYRRGLSRAAEAAITLLAYSDPLTGIGNLRAFDGFAERIEASEAKNVGLVMLDANGLRATNSVFGYDAGDDLLVRLAKVLATSSSETAQAARIGGDEFALLLPGATAEEIAQWRDDFIANVDRHNQAIRGRAPQLSVAIGSAVSPADGASAAELLDAADRRLYAQKNPAVKPPHELDEQAETSSARPLRPFGPQESTLDELRAREISLQGGVSWLLAAAALAAWPLLPGVEIPHPAGTIALGIACACLAAISFVARTPRLERLSLLIVGDASVVLAAPGIWVTGGWHSPFQALGVLAIAYVSQFHEGAAAIKRCGILIAGYAVAFWTSGTVSPAGQSLFATIVTAEIVLAAVLQANARETRNSMRTIRDAATHDVLTGAGNLRAFRTHADKAMSALAGPEKHFPTVVLADIDNFRAVNNLVGHRGGDAILREVALRLAAPCAGECDVYRVGGDEFALLCGAGCLKHAHDVAEECAEALSFDLPTPQGEPVSVSASVGFAIAYEGMSSESLLRAAESDLDQRKGERGGQRDAGGQLYL
ncbi:MAG: diguanylate cyclase domain-containing protein [Solirubrobacterales bacterium]